MSVNSRDRSDGVTQLCLKWDKGGMYLSKFVLLGFGVFWGGIVCLCFCCFYLVCWVGFFLVVWDLSVTVLCLEVFMF